MKKVMIAIPAYDGKCEIGVALSLVRGIELAKKITDRIEIGTLCGMCYIAEARNHIANSFLNDDADELVFIDADVSFDCNALSKIIGAGDDKEIVAGAYPYKYTSTKGWPVKIKVDGNNIPIGDRETGHIECDFAPTGFMKIKKSVFLKLKKLHPEWECTERINHNQMFDFFQTGVLFREQGESGWFGEDVSFCRYCNMAGIKIWLEPNITFTHGQVSGNFHKYLLDLPGAIK